MGPLIPLPLPQRFWGLFWAEELGLPAIAALLGGGGRSKLMSGCSRGVTWRFEAPNDSRLSSQASATNVNKIKAT